MGVKVKDIAASLNLSPSTVSLVLNNRPGISEATRKKVRDAVKELGCEEILAPEIQENKTILFVVYRKHGQNVSDSSYFSQLFSEIIEGVEYQARVKGYKLMISYIDRNNFNQEAARIRKEDAQGIILLATEMNEAQLSAFRELEVPIVVLDNYSQQNPFECVVMNNELGVYEAISYLADCGHTDIGYLHLVDNAYNFEERYFGYLRAMELYGIPVKRENILEIDTEGGEEVYIELKKRLQERKSIPTAFFADNDIVALWAMRVLQEMGYQIPSQISIVGFDDMTLSEMLNPPLTTVRIPKKKMGMAAVNAMIEKIQEQDNGVMKNVVTTSLIVRKSVKNLKKS